MFHLWASFTSHAHPTVFYSGDMIMTAAWCATTGTASVVPYFQIVYFVILLAHRQMRDDEACAKKSVIPSNVVSTR